MIKGTFGPVYHTLLQSKDLLTLEAVRMQKQILKLFSLSVRVSHSKFGGNMHFIL